MKKILLLLIVCYVGFICWTRLPVLEQATLETANHEFALRLITLNTEYWHTSEVEMLAQLDYTKMDFVLLQEHLEQRGDSYFPTNRIPELRAAAPQFHISDFGEVVTVSRWPVVETRRFGEGTALRTDHKLASGSLVSVYNVHMPVHIHFDLLSAPGEFIRDLYQLVGVRDKLTAQLMEDIAGNANPIIVAGDFNTSIAMNSVQWLSNRFTDSYSAPQCEWRYGTWSLAGLLSWRIDYVFTSAQLTPRYYCTREVANISDHRAVYTELMLNNRSQGGLHGS